jgi:hypothetical protein
MVRLSLRAQSLYGRKIANSLKATERSLNMRCSCPPGQSCSVEVNELGRRQFEVVVTRPGPVTDSQDWASVAPSAVGRYRRLFDRRTSADRIAASVSKIVGAPLEDRREADSNGSTAPHGIALIDAVLLEKIRSLVIGCHMCSPFAEVPLFVILDQFREATTISTQYVFEQSPSCSRCGRQMTEHTLVDMEAEL